MAAAAIAESAIGSAIAESAAKSSNLKRLYDDTIDKAVGVVDDIVEAGEGQVSKLAKRIETTLGIGGGKATKRKNVRYVTHGPPAKRPRVPFRHPEAVQKEIALARLNHKDNMNWFRMYSANLNTVRGRFAPVGDRSYYRKPEYRYKPVFRYEYPYYKRYTNREGHRYYRRRWKKTRRWHKKFVRWYY